MLAARVLKNPIVSYKYIEPYRAEVYLLTKYVPGVRGFPVVALNRALVADLWRGFCMMYIYRNLD